MKQITLIRFSVALIGSLTILASSGVAAAAKLNLSSLTGSPYTSGQVGTDVSWPNCTAANPKSAFGIVGATDGTGYSQNPCLAAEASWYKSLSLYVNTGWNDQSQHINATSPNVCAPGAANCLAYNYGYNAGLYAVNYASSLGIHSATWWLDVENGNTWNADTTQNRSSLQGEYDALKANGVTTVGVYSTTAQWDSLTGTWLNNWPNWGATTWHTAKQAKTYCTGHQFTGGPTYLIQFTGTLDQDYAC